LRVEREDGEDSTTDLSVARQVNMDQHRFQQKGISDLRSEISKKDEESGAAS
jgi:hypothetical protein